jgi:hypothetical protein
VVDHEPATPVAVVDHEPATPVAVVDHEPATPVAVVDHREQLRVTPGSEANGGSPCKCPSPANLTCGCKMQLPKTAEKKRRSRRKDKIYKPNTPINVSEGN